MQLPVAGLFNLPSVILGAKTRPILTPCRYYDIVLFEIVISTVGGTMTLRYLSPIHKATRQIGLFLEPRCAALGVSPAEGHLLSYLRSYAPCPIGEVVRVFGIRPSTMTSMLE